jgi:hypothetical protein
MRQIIVILTCAIVGCGDDSPTGPGEELVGTWVGVSTIFANTLWTFRADGTFTLSLEFVYAYLRGHMGDCRWQVDLVADIAGLFTQDTLEFTVMGDRLTIVQYGTVEIYERRSA